MADDFIWTEARVTTLIRLWAVRREQKLSAESIGQQLGTTRNAVLGKINRLGLSEPSPVRPKEAPLRVNGSGAPVARPRPPVIEEVAVADKPEGPWTPIPDSPPVPEGGITLVELRSDSCRWPLNSPVPFDEHRICGQPKLDGSVYCATHHALAYTPNTKKARLAPRT